MTPIPELQAPPKKIDWTCPRCDGGLQETPLDDGAFYICHPCKNGWREEDLEEAHGRVINPYSGAKAAYYEDTRRGVKGGSSGGSTGKAKEKKFIRGAAPLAPWCEEETPEVREERIEKNTSREDFKLWKHLRKYGAEVSTNFLRQVISKKIFEKLSENT